jgi:hypothetical protein
MGDPPSRSQRQEWCNSRAPRRAARRTRAEARARAIGAALAISLAVAGASRAGADDGMPGLDEQVQQIKSDVLAIATELRQLEEKLLYPSDTQVSVFISLENGESVELDSIRVQIDGEPVARHVYSFKELDALRRGGVQRIYTGNLPTGEHSIEVSMAGTLAGGTPFEETGSFPFQKEIAPKVVGLTLVGETLGGARIQLGGW